MMTQVIKYYSRTHSVQNATLFVRRPHITNTFQSPQCAMNPTHTGQNVRTAIQRVRNFTCLIETRELVQKACGSF